LSESELDRLEAQEKRDKADVENQARKSTKGSSDHSSKKGVLGKRPRPSVELSYEYEHEREDNRSKSVDKVKAKRPRTGKTVDF